MQEENLIAAEEFCNNYNVEISFIQSLSEYGLIEITTIEEKGFIPASKLTDIERYMRLHYDLDINMAGIEAIAHMLERINRMQKEMINLQNKLRLYERL